MSWDDQADEEWVGDESGDSDDDLMECPLCHGSVHEETQQCPHCHDWITPVYASTNTRPMWWILVVVALIASLVLFF